MPTKTVKKKRTHPKYHYVVRHVVKKNGQKKMKAVGRIHGGFIGAMLASVAAPLVSGLLMTGINKLIHKKHGAGVYSLMDPLTGRHIMLRKHTGAKLHKGLRDKDAEGVSMEGHAIYGMKIPKDAHFRKGAGPVMAAIRLAKANKAHKAARAAGRKKSMTGTSVLYE